MRTSHDPGSRRAVRPTRDAADSRVDAGSWHQEHSRQERYYIGRRSPGTDVYVVSSAAIEPLEHHRYRSSAPFDWGVRNPGSLELAFATLTHATGRTPPDLICLTFWTAVTARLDRPEFVLCHGDIALWLLTAFDNSPGSGEPPPRRRRSRHTHPRRVRTRRRRC